MIVVQALEQIPEDKQPKAKAVLQAVNTVFRNHCGSMPHEDAMAVLAVISAWVADNVKTLGDDLQKIKDNPVPVDMSATMKASSNMKAG